MSNTTTEELSITNVATPIESISTTEEPLTSTFDSVSTTIDVSLEVLDPDLTVPGEPTTFNSTVDFQAEVSIEAN